MNEYKDVFIEYIPQKDPISSHHHPRDELRERREARARIG